MNGTLYFSRVIIPGDKGIVKALEEAHNLIFRTNPTSGPVSQEKSDSSEVCRILMDGIKMEEQSGFFTAVKKQHVFVRLQEEQSVSQTFLTDVTFMGYAPVCLLPGGTTDAHLLLFATFYFAEILHITLIDS